MQASSVSDKGGRVLTTAIALFMANGYETTSMDAVAERAGVSKATIYVHFARKEHLFAAAVAEECRRLENEFMTAAATEQHPEIALLQIALQFLTFILSPRTLALYRVLVAEALRFPELGRAFFEAGPAIMENTLESYLAKATSRGHLTIRDIRLAAAQLIGMIKGDLQVRCLFDPAWHPSATQIEEQARGAIEVFLTLYGCGAADAEANTTPHS